MMSVTPYNITAAQLAMDELLEDVRVPGADLVAQMDGAEDTGIIDDLTFAELFTQDALFQNLEQQPKKNVSPTVFPTSAASHDEPSLAAVLFSAAPTTAPATAAQEEAALAAALFSDLPTTLPVPVHRRAPNSRTHTVTSTATVAAMGAVVGATAAPVLLPGQGQLETPEWNGIIPDRFEDLEEEMISLIPHRELAKLMARSRMTEKQIAEAKKLRRRVKNRQSARVCSTRKRVTTKATEYTNAELHDSISNLTAQNQGLLQQHLQLQQQVIAMQKAQQDAVREKLAMEAEVQRMEKMLQDAMKNNIHKGVEAASNAPIDFPLPDTLFAIAA